MLVRLRDKLLELGRESLSPRPPTAYLYAIGCVVVAALADCAFDYFIDGLTPSVFYYPAVFAVTLFCGVRAGLAAVVLSAALVWWIDAKHFGDVSGELGEFNRALYVTAAAVIIWAAERFRQVGERQRQADVVVRIAKASATTNRRLLKLRQFWRDGLPPNSAAAFAFAVACTAVATAFRFSLGALGENILPFACFYPSVLVATLFGGVGAGLLAMVLGLLVAGWAFIPPHYSFGLPTQAEVIEYVLFLFASMLAVWLAERYRGAVLRRERDSSAILEFVAPVIVSFGVVLLTSLVVLAVEPNLGTQYLVFAYLIPTTIVALLYGSTSALLTSFVSGLAALYFLYPPKFALYVTDPLHIVELALFMLVALATSKIVPLLTFGGRGESTSRRREDRSIFLRGNSSRAGVLLIHGVGGSPLELKATAIGLAEQGFTVSCCQLAGHDGSEDDLLAAGWKDWYASAERALANLEKQCDVIVLGGLSVGSILALRLAAIHPTRVQGLCLFAPTLRYDGWAIPWYSFLLTLGVRAPFLRRMRIPDPPPYGIKYQATSAAVDQGKRVADSAHPQAPSTSLGMLQEAFWLVRDVVRRLPSIKTPTLIVHSREDDISNLSNAIDLQRRLAGLVQCVVLDDSYHNITLDRQRDLVVERTADFIGFIEQRAKAAQPQSAPPRPALVAGHEFPATVHTP